MTLHKFAWVLWLIGSAIIVLSWIDVVPAQVGWLGFVVAMVGVVISYVPQPVDPSQYPLTQEGFPVEPSGVPVPADMPLESGSPVLAFSQGRWWRAAVVEACADGQVVVTYPGWDPRWRERLRRGFLQVDPDPSRQPLRLPPKEALNPLPALANPDAIKPGELRDGMHGRQ
jgi:hypothetical protein